jgi:hypothetical protein
MLGILHRAASLVLTAVVWFGSLTPITSQWLMAQVAANCCRHKCCCHRVKHTGSGPAMSARSCDAGCAMAPATPVAAAESIAKNTHAPQIVVIAAAAAPESHTPRHTSLVPLYQRPPPVHI